ncbi:MAG: glucose-1-phosphate adenylyltransferase [Myxococcales bacterium]
MGARAKRVAFSQRVLAQTVTMILAGGKGERLMPLTEQRSKPSVPFGGKYRIIDFMLSNCVNSGFRRIMVLTQYKSQSLTEHLQRGWSVLNPELGEYVTGVPPQLLKQDRWYEGTADAIFQNVIHVEAQKPQHVLILSGDHVYKMDYSLMMRAHLDSGADLTLCSMPYDREESALRFGIVETDAEGRVVRFLEKPARPPAMPGDPSKSLVNMGIYLFRAQALYDVLASDAEIDSSHDFGKDIIPSMLERYNVRSYAFEDENPGTTPYWRDIGTIESYYEANMDLISVTPQFNLYDASWPIRTYQGQAPPAKTVFADEGVRYGVMVDSIACGGVIVSGGRVTRSILGPNVRVHSYSTVEDSILLDNVEIGRRARVRRAIIDKNVVVPPGCEIGFDPERDRERFHVSDTGIVVIPKNAVIGM